MLTSTVGTGDDDSPINSPTNSSGNVIPPGVKRQFENFREVSVTAMHNVSR